MGNNTKNIMIVGVGGQGTLLTSRILGGITVDAGYDVKLSEVHGMAQRGGSVVTFVDDFFHLFLNCQGTLQDYLIIERMEACDSSCWGRCNRVIVILYTIDFANKFDSVFNTAEGCGNSLYIVGSHEVICCADCRHIVFNIVLSRKENIRYFDDRFHTIVNGVTRHVNISAVILG